MAKPSANPNGSPSRRMFMVQTFTDVNGAPEYTFFGSKKAIFEYFGNSALHVGYGTIATRNLSNTPYQNAVCRIVEGKLFGITSEEVIARRKAEGREKLPIRNSAIYNLNKS